MPLLEKLDAEAPSALNRRLLDRVKSLGGPHLQAAVTLIAIAVDADQATQQERESSRIAAP